MANAAYTVDFTEATRPAMDAAKDITSIQGMQSRAAYEGAATEAAQTQNQLAKMQVAEAQRQEAALNKRVPLDSMKKLQEMFPNTTGGMYQMAKDMNMIESVGGKESMSVRDMQSLGKLADQTHEMSQKHFEWMSKDLDMQEASLTQKISEAKKPEEKKALGDQLTKLKEQQSKLYNMQYKRDMTVKEMAKDYTPASIAKWNKTGNMEDLVPLKIAEAGVKAEGKAADRAAQEAGANARNEATNKSREKAAGIKARAAGGGEDIPPGKPGEVNTGALRGLNNTQSETVKAIAEYRFPVSNLRNKNMMALVQRAYAYDPTFDAKEYAVRAAVRKDFTSGKTANNINSLNTAIGHLDQMYEKAQALDNSKVPLWNWVANKGLQATGDKRVAGFNTTATAVESELASVFKGMGATDQEIKAWRDGFSSSSSPAQFRESIVDASTKLMGSRLDALRNKYQQGMGKPADFKMLSEKSHQILKKIGADTNMIDPGEKQDMGGGAAPQKIGRFTVEVQ